MIRKKSEWVKMLSVLASFDQSPATVKPVLSRPVLNGHPLLSGQLTGVLVVPFRG